MRILQSFLGGLFVTFVLFGIMTTLVSGSQQQADSSVDVNLQDFVRVAREERTELKQREVPKKPEPPKRPETPQQVTQQQEQVNQQRINIDIPKIDVPFGGGGGPFIPAGAGGGAGAGNFGDGDVIPIVRIEPQFPREALLNGISGYVVVEFTIVEDGSVAPGSTRVLESSPPRLFDREAMRAIARWKFKPRVVDGRPIRRTASQKIDFKLDEDDKR